MKFSSHKKILMILLLVAVLAGIVYIRLEPGVKKDFALSELFSVESYIKSIEKNSKITIGVDSEQQFHEMTAFLKDLDLVDYDVRMIYPKEFQEITFERKLNHAEQEEYEAMRFELLSGQVKEGIIDVLYSVDLEDLEKLYEKNIIVSLKEQVNALNQANPIHKGAYHYLKNMSDGEFYFISPTFSVENYMLVNQNFYNTPLDQKWLALNELRGIHDQIENKFESKNMTTFTFNTVLDDWDHIHLAFSNLIRTCDIPLVEDEILFKDERWKLVLDDFLSIVKKNRYLYGTVGTGLGADWAYSQGVIGMKVTPLYDLHHFFNEHTIMAENNISIHSFHSSLCFYSAHSDFKGYLDITSDSLAFSVNIKKNKIDSLLNIIFSEEFALSLLEKSKEKPNFPYFSTGGGLPIPCVLNPEIKEKYLNKLNKDVVQDIEILFDGEKVKKVKNTKEDEEILNVLFRTDLSPYMDGSIDIEKLILNMRERYKEIKSRLENKE